MTRTNEIDGARRAFLGLGRGTIKATDDAKAMQLADLDMRTDEAPTEVEHFLPYGISFRPHPGAEVITAYLGGNASHPAVLLTSDRRYRVNNLAEGEVVVHDDQGQMVHFKRDEIFMKSNTQVTIEAPILNLGGTGGKAVARIGDGTTDGAAIAEGSTIVFAVD